MSTLELITKHVAVDTTTQREGRSSVFGCISLEKYVIGIDSGASIDVGKAFRQEIDAIFNIPIKYLFLTHTHSDHRGGIDAFKDTTLVLSQKSIENMPTSIKLNTFTTEPFANNFSIKEDGLKVEFLHVGGHSIDSSVAYFPSEKILYAGDIVFSKPMNFGLPFMSFYQNKPKKTGNPEEYLSAFEAFLKMDLKTIIPGHGELILNPREYLLSLKSFFIDLKEYFLEAIGEGKSIIEITMPNLEPINQAFEELEKRTSKSVDKKFLENYLNHIKTSFYNYYRSEYSNI